MTINYNPKDAVTLAPVGIHPAVIESIEEKKSKQGNDMAAVSLKVYVGERTFTVFDYWVFTPGGLWKVKQVAKALGINFDAGVFNADDYLNKSLKVDLTTEKQPGYDEKNKVQEYLPKNSAGSVTPEEQDKRINKTPLSGDDYATSMPSDDDEAF